tara:strand:- start:154 stop:738 length:585 start_codon:yes stop_codon:yes gene_type:complete
MNLVMQKLILILSLSLMFFSCSPKVLYDDPRKVETLTINFSSTDLQIISQAMVDSLLQSVITNNDNKPIIVIEEVKNKTAEYIDTSIITDSIRAKLSNSGLVQFGVNIDELDGQISEIDRQQNEYYDENLNVEKGKLAGADFRLAGSLISIDKVKKKLFKTKKDKFYKLSLQLWNIKTGVMVWADEKDIRKTEG